VIFDQVPFNNHIEWLDFKEVELAHMRLARLFLQGIDDPDEARE
jgi:hypothetical protein